MMLHVAGRGWHTNIIAASGWYATDLHSFEWQVFNFWHGSIVRWAVPVFVMISGALFLSRDIPIRKIYGKYIFRIFTAFVFWSFIYALADYAMKRDIYGAAVRFLSGHETLWFLPMIIGLYMIQPFMKKIAESELLTRYFLVLVIIFTFLMPEAVKLISLFSKEYGILADGLVNRFRPNFVVGLTGYFLMGYVLNNLKMTPKIKRLIYALGIFGLLWGQSLSVIASFVMGNPNQVFYEHISVCRLCTAMAVFIFFKEKFNRPSQIIRTLAKYTFGAYLVHAAVIGIIVRFCISPLAFSPIFSVPVISVIVFVISFAISAVLNNIPIVKKYIV